MDIIVNNGPLKHTPIVGWLDSLKILSNLARTTLYCIVLKCLGIIKVIYRSFVNIFFKVLEIITDYTN